MEPQETQTQVRLQKFIADHGIASRRKAEELIYLGLVTVNGKVIRKMGTKITPNKDAIKVDGKLVQQTTKHVYIALYKPLGVVTTLHDPEERTTIKDLLVGIKQRVYPVGRLDYDSEGLIILTNDGAYAQSVAHPKKSVRKVYRVKIKGKPQPHHLERLKLGVTLAEGRVKVAHIERFRDGTQHDWFKVVLTEGKNRQIRRMFEKIGFDVLKIKRVAIGHLTLGSLERGQYRWLTKEEAFLALK